MYKCIHFARVFRGHISGLYMQNKKRLPGNSDLFYAEKLKYKFIEILLDVTFSNTLSLKKKIYPSLTPDKYSGSFFKKKRDSS